MSYETILLDKKEGIACLTLNRPQNANTISLQLRNDVTDALGEIETDAHCRVVIITGAGRHFCGGADLRDPARRRGTRAAPDSRPRRGMFEVIEASRVPVIAAINGAAMGGGCEMALACDIRVIADTATIGLPEIRFGALPAGGGTQRLPRLVGSGIAKEMIFSGLPWSATDAYRIGLVNRVVPAADLMTTCEEMARVFIDRAAYALKAAKMLVNRGMNLPRADGLKLERSTIAEMATPEEKRAAREQAAANQKTYARIFSKNA
ncbi:MAG: enoyl-CoA hydratase/isomerase family protein [Candidatus Binataceae bacterium]